MSLKEFLYRTFGFISCVVIFYLIGAFIAWDLHPLNWWLFTSTIGRIIAIVWIICLLWTNYLEDSFYDGV